MNTIKIMSRMRALAVLTEIGFRRTMHETLNHDSQGRLINEWKLRRDGDTYTVYLLFDGHDFQYWSIVDDDTEKVLFQANRAERLLEKVLGLSQCEMDQ